MKHAKKKQGKIKPKIRAKRITRDRAEVEPIPEPAQEIELTDRQRVFVEEYLTCWNASESARRAGYRGRANTVGPRLLANVGIQKYVEKRLSEKAMKADEVLARLADEARGTLSDSWTLTGGFL